MINDVRLAVSDCRLFHKFETTRFAWFVNLWCHDVVRKYFFFHRRIAIVYDCQTMCFKITSFHLSKI